MLSSAYPVHGSASEVNRSGADAQVVSCQHYLVVFLISVEQLTVSCTSGLVLTSSSILPVFHLDLHPRWHHVRHMAKRYVNYV